MKINRKTFFSLCAVSLLTLLLAGTLIIYTLYNNFVLEIRSQLGEECAYISSAVELNSADYLESIAAASSNRITHIAADGSVLFDNRADAASLENHIDRPEISEAMKNGSGEATRLSATLGEKTYYCARLLSDGSVIRLAVTTKSAFGVIASASAMLALICVAVLIVTAFISKALTQSIVRPINNLSLDEPLKNETYDELAPLLVRIDRQNKTIAGQIKTITSKQNEIEYITDNMREAFIIFGSSGKVLYLNRSAEFIFPQGKGKSYAQICRDGDYLSGMEEALGGNMSSFKLHLADNTYAVSVSPAGGLGGDYAVVMMMVDITLSEAAEEIRREFSANVSHELKTPLASITGYAEIIENGLADEKDVPVFAGRIKREAERQLSLINDIIRLSNLEEKNYEGEKAAVELYALAEEVVDGLREKAEKRNISLSLSGEKTEVRGIRHILYEILYNLTDNAVSYTPEGGSVNVNICEADGLSVLKVSDNGIGIPKKDIERVFERFYRVDKSRSKETGGTGLGLSIVKHGVKLHSGKVNIESAEGKGTVVTVTLASKHKN